MRREALGCAGMSEDSAVVGATAVERVAGMIQLGERGIPTAATQTLLDASWVEPTTTGSQRARSEVGSINRSAGVP